MDHYTPINQTIEFTTRANSLLNPLNPHSGLLLIGDGGVEFQGEKSPGYIQIPWQFVTEVRVQLLFWDRYVRGFTIQTKDDETGLHEFEFIVKDAKSALKVMRRHLDRPLFVRQRSNFGQLFKKKKD
ncbi:MAG: DUF956 family protein [Aerococcus sp.]|nr:DUF956 family protein [Aerococcus sp.]